MKTVVIKVSLDDLYFMMLKMYSIKAYTALKGYRDTSNALLKEFEKELQ